MAWKNHRSVLAIYFDAVFRGDSRPVSAPDQNGNKPGWHFSNVLK
ncbi:hypothetical protein SAMN05880582_102152 [Rhizobium sp. RU20A]|nr:hypothetical protein [Rhizobium sp. RU20A]SIQ56523.1 hypothetical protein SAMN05880582_102152 [Rhizobium sp. RU20A]